MHKEQRNAGGVNQIWDGFQRISGSDSSFELIILMSYCNSTLSSCQDKEVRSQGLEFLAEKMQDRKEFQSCLAEFLGSVLFGFISLLSRLGILLSPKFLIPGSVQSQVRWSFEHDMESILTPGRSLELDEL